MLFTNGKKYSMIRILPLLVPKKKFPKVYVSGTYKHTQTHKITKREQRREFF